MISTEIVNWLTQRSTILEKRLKIHRAYIHYPNLSTASNLLLSDELLCGAIPSMKPPPNFEDRMYWITSPEKSERIPHTAWHNQGMVIDLVAGQFYADEERNISGIGKMMRIAPHLFIELTDLVVAMCGTQEDILSSLQLTYKLKS